MRILVIEDNHDLAANIGEFLEERGCVVDYAADGVTGLHLATVGSHDAVVLDLNLAGMDGLTLCRRLRRDGQSDVPVLMLTARDTDRDVVAGFDAGADDYLCKPFSLQVLEARLRALQRRARGAGDRLSVADLTLDLSTLQARRGSRRLSITPIGLRMLEALMRASPAVVRRAQLEAAVWGDDPPDSDAALRVHIRALRSEIDRDGELPLLHTVHSIGYRLARDEDG